SRALGRAGERSLRGVGGRSRCGPAIRAGLLPIFDRPCTTYHGEDGLEGGLDLRSLQQVRAGGDSGPSVVAQSAAESLIFQRVSTREMPPDGSMLSDDEIDLLRRWIDGGA